jgi:hypothetical protein
MRLKLAVLVDLEEIGHHHPRPDLVKRDEDLAVTVG